MTSPRRPPGPRGHAVLGNMPALREDWIGTMTRAARTYGSVVRMRMPWPLKDVVLVTDPELAERVLLDDAAAFEKSRMTRRMAEPILGSGLLLAEGDAWRRQRSIVQPALHKAAVAAYVDAMARGAEAMVDAWPLDGRRDVYEDALECTVGVAARTMFGELRGDESRRARRALGEALAAFDGYKRSRLPLPLGLPTPRGLRLQRASRELESVIFALIDRGMRGGPTNLLAAFAEARDDEGRGLGRRQLRDEAVTIFAGGTETTAVALAWALSLLAAHPDAADAVRAEVRAVVGGGRVEARHLDLFAYTNGVVKEALRLFPPAWKISREAAAPYRLGDYDVEAGTTVVVGTYLMHHDERLYPDAEAFRPERWRAGRAGRPGDEAALPRCAYLPFGAGRRVCVGQAFAMAELVTALATVVPRARFDLPGGFPERQAGAMLRPKQGAALRVRREGAAVPASPDGIIAS